MNRSIYTSWFTGIMELSSFAFLASLLVSFGNKPLEALISYIFALLYGLLWGEGIWQMLAILFAFALFVLIPYMLGIGTFFLVKKIDSQ